MISKSRNLFLFEWFSWLVVCVLWCRMWVMWCRILLFVLWLCRLLICLNRLRFSCISVKGVVVVLCVVRFSVVLNLCWFINLVSGLVIVSVWVILWVFFS